MKLLQNGHYGQCPHPARPPSPLVLPPTGNSLHRVYKSDTLIFTVRNVCQPPQAPPSVADGVNSLSSSTRTYWLPSLDLIELPSYAKRSWTM
ncbi:hypothetical protein PISMIDRAFT_272406 [Pisolithus microcarpus 441]|uniref:Uncharacterized protein n=1 Tax=Pisolithus microcarpus 441 TaxID=765257 RepID=A0A0C9YMT6_9AGAM|nr:hypothetical protein PISMIDRAFT_272406 [Pisolithus microcarpus 441]